MKPARSGSKARAPPVERLRAAASKASAPVFTTPDPIGTFDWQPGKPAHLDELSRAGFEKCVRNAFTIHGYFPPDLTVSLPIDAQKGTADLEVLVNNEGPPVRLGEIEISGAERTPREAVILLLGLQRGTPLNEEQVSAAGEKLYASGRFLRESVTVGKPAADGAANLLVELREYDKVPPLGQELSAEEKLLLEVYLRAKAVKEGRQHIEVIVNGLSVGGRPVDLVGTFARERGCVISLREGDETDAIIAAAAFSPPGPQGGGKVSLVAPARKLEIRENLLPAQMMLSIGIIADPDRDKERPFSLKLVSGFSTRKTIAAPIELVLNFDPVAFLGMAHSKGSTCWIENGVLTVKSEGPAGGQGGSTTSVSLTDDKLLVLRTMPGGHTVTARVSTGLLEERLAEIWKAGEKLPDAFDAAKPYGSLAEFVVADVLSAIFAQPDSAAVLRSLGRIARTLPFDEAKAPEGAGEPPAEFRIPQERVMTDAAAEAIALSRELFPPDSWPAVLTREIALLMCGKGAIAEVRRLYEDDRLGPVSCFAVASVFRLLGMSQIGQPFARKGLAGMTPADFRKDAAVLFSQEGGVGRTIARLAGAIGGAGDAAASEAIEPLAAQLGPREAALLRESAELLKAAPDKPLVEVLAPALDEYWQASLRERVQQALVSLLRADQPTPP